MKLHDVVYLAFVFALPVICATAQFPIPTPEFSCKPRIVLNWVNGAIPVCTDTIVLPTDPPPSRDSSDMFLRGASLHRLVWSGDELTMGEEIECDVISEPPALNVALVLRHHLPTYESDGTPINYQVNLYCGYWSHINEDTTSIRFTVYSRYYALAEARLVADSSLLPSELLVSPISTPQSGYSILTPLIITARDGVNDVVFDHWTSSDARIIPDRYGREQIVADGCWPISDTVRFTAWYSGNGTSSVRDDKENRNGAQYHDDLPATASVLLFDLQGRQVNLERSSVVVNGRLVDFKYSDIVKLPGIYILVVTTAEGVRWTQPLLILH